MTDPVRSEEMITAGEKELSFQSERCSRTFSHICDYTANWKMLPLLKVG